MKIKIQVYESKEGNYVYKFRTNSVLPHIVKELICCQIDNYLTQKDITPNSSNNG